MGTYNEMLSSFLISNICCWKLKGYEENDDSVHEVFDEQKTRSDSELL